MPSLLKNELVALQKEAGTITKAQELLALCKIFTNNLSFFNKCVLTFKFPYDKIEQTLYRSGYYEKERL